MTSNPGKHSVRRLAWIGAAILAADIGVTTWLGLSPGPAETDTEVASETIAANAPTDNPDPGVKPVTAPDPDDSIIVNREPLERNIVKGRQDPDISSRSEPETEKPSNDIIEKVLTALKSDNPDEGIDAYRFLQRCKNSVLTDADLQSRYEALEDLAANPAVTSETMMGLELSLESQIEVRVRCRELHDNKTGIVNKIENAADEGAQVARFLFAMSSPSDAISTLMAGKPLWDYESRAFNYTLDNLLEGHALGLYAMGMSYSTGEHFTPQRLSLGSAFLLAYQLCAGEEVDAKNRIKLNETVTAAQAGFSQIAKEDQILATANRLYESYCASSISNALE